MAVLTFVTLTGLGVVSLPSALAKEAGHDAWISLLISGLLATIVSVLLAVLLNRYVDKDIYDINKYIFGSIIGTFLNLLLFSYLIMAAARGVRVFTLFLRLTVLPMSPPVAISPFVLLPSIYLVYQGVKYIARFKYLSGISYLLVLLFMVLLLDQLKFSFLLPVGEAGITPILSSIPISFQAFIGLELIVFLFPLITNKSKAFIANTAAIVLSLLFFLMVMVVSTALFGAEFLSIQTIPLFNMARSYNAPIVERVDLYIVALWLIVMGCAMRAYMFTAYYSLEKLFRVKKSPISLGLFFVALVALSRIPRDINQAFMFLELSNYIGIAVLLYFVFCLLLSFVRTKGVKST